MLFEIFNEENDRLTKVRYDINPGLDDSGSPRFGLTILVSLAPLLLVCEAPLRLAAVSSPETDPSKGEVSSGMVLRELFEFNENWIMIRNSSTPSWRDRT